MERDYGLRPVWLNLVHGSMLLQARDEAKARGGDTFSLKDFHTKALSLGAMGLEPLREALARF